MDDLYNSKVRLGGALHCQAKSSHSLLSLWLSTLEKQGVYSSLSLLLFGGKQPLAEAHPRLSLVSLLTVEVVVSDLHTAIKLTAERTRAISHSFAGYRRFVRRSPPPPAACFWFVFLRLSFLLCLSVCSGLQRFQLAPGWSALLAAPNAVHRG